MIAELATLKQAKTRRFSSWNPSGNNGDSGNHLANEMSSVAYWYSAEPVVVIVPPPVARRLPVPRNPQGVWVNEKRIQCPGKAVKVNAEMRKNKKAWAKLHP